MKLKSLLVHQELGKDVNVQTDTIVTTKQEVTIWKKKLSVAQQKENLWL